MTISDTKLAGWRTLSDWMWQPQVSFAVLFIMKSGCRQHIHDMTQEKKPQIISICVPSSVRLNMTGSGGIRARQGLLHLRDFLGFIRAVQRSTCCSASCLHPACSALGQWLERWTAWEETRPSHLHLRSETCLCCPAQAENLQPPSEKKLSPMGGWKLCCWHDNVQYVCACFQRLDCSGLCTIFLCHRVCCFFLKAHNPSYVNGIFFKLGIGPRESTWEM